MKFKLTFTACSLLAKYSLVGMVFVLVLVNFGFSQEGNDNANRQEYKHNSKSLLTQSANYLENSSPLQCATRMQINLFDQKFIASGRYLQMGQGSGMSRLEFSFDDDDRPGKILQICSHGYYYRFRTTGRTPELNVADLRQIAKSDSGHILATPNTWMATGGLASLLKNLSTNFEFDQPEATTLGEIPVWKFRGRWNEQRLKRILFGQVKYAIIKNQIQWDKMPTQVPHSCEIVLGRDQFFPLFPYRIAFFKNEKVGQTLKTKQVVALELYDLNKHANLDGQLFEVNFPDVLPNDMTSQYVDRILQLHKIQRSANQPEPNKATR